MEMAIYIYLLSYTKIQDEAKISKKLGHFQFTPEPSIRCCPFLNRNLRSTHEKLRPPESNDYDIK